MRGFTMQTRHPRRSRQKKSAGTQVKEQPARHIQSFNLSSFDRGSVISKRRATALEKQAERAGIKPLTSHLWYAERRETLLALRGVNFDPKTNAGAYEWWVYHFLLHLKYEVHNPTYCGKWVTGVSVSMSWGGVKANFERRPPGIPKLQKLLATLPPYAEEHDIIRQVNFNLVDGSQLGSEKINLEQMLNKAISIIADYYDGKLNGEEIKLPDLTKVFYGQQLARYRDDLLKWNLRLIPDFVREAFEQGNLKAASHKLDELNRLSKWISGLQYKLTHDGNDRDISEAFGIIEVNVDHVRTVEGKVRDVFFKMLVEESEKDDVALVKNEAGILVSSGEMQKVIDTLKRHALNQLQLDCRERRKKGSFLFFTWDSSAAGVSALWNELQTVSSNNTRLSEQFNNAVKIIDGRPKRKRETKREGDVQDLYDNYYKDDDSVLRKIQQVELGACGYRVLLTAVRNTSLENEKNILTALSAFSKFDATYKISDIAYACQRVLSQLRNQITQLKRDRSDAEQVESFQSMNRLNEAFCYTMLYWMASEIKRLYMASWLLFHLCSCALFLP